MNRKFATLAVLLSFCAIAHAQEQKKGVEAFVDQLNDRGLTRVLYWNLDTDASAGELCIDYGRPIWKAEYDAPGAFDKMTMGKTWRMGKEQWTVLDTNLPLKIAGQNVAAGSYYLGVQRSVDGASWSLNFMDPAKVRAAKLDAFEIEKAPVAFKAPLTFKITGEASEALNISLSQPTKENLKNVTLKISWGKYELSAPVQVVM